MGRSAPGSRAFAVVFALLVAGCGGAATKVAKSPEHASTVRVASPPPSASSGPSTPPPSAPEARPASDSSVPSRPTAIPGTSITFPGGDGSSIDRAVVIHGAKGETDGVAAEYWYVGALLGERGVDWHLKSQSLLGRRGHQYDLLDVVAGGADHQFYFDITEYFGRF